MAHLDELLDALRAAPSRDGLLNPYASADSPSAPAVAEEVGEEADGIRAGNLTAYLGALLESESDTLLCGEAPSCVGTRWTGVAFTSEREVVAGEFPLHGCRLLPAAAQEERRLMKETSALHLWRALARAPKLPVLWNALPLHPHPPGNPRTNRTPGRKEVELGRPALEALIGLVRPRRIVALGRTAEAALKALGHDAVYVRHPAHGGSRKMTAQLQELGIIGPAD